MTFIVLISIHIMQRLQSVDRGAGGMSLAFDAEGRRFDPYDKPVFF